MKKIRFTALIGLVVLIVVLTSSAFADDIHVSGLFTYTIKGNGTAIITDFNWEENANADVFIPRMLDGYTVTEIGEYAFSNEEASLDNLVGNEVIVTIPDTITTIGKKAFFCTKVNILSLPASVQSIGDGAFAGCVNIGNFNVADGNNVFATIDGALYNKQIKELTAYPTQMSVSIPKGILSIGNYACYGNKKTIKEIPSSITQIGNYAFAECSCTLSPYFRHVKTIGKYAFFESDIHFNATLTDVFLYLEEIGEYAFYRASLSSDTPICFPSNVKYIGEGAFACLRRKLDSFDLHETQITVLEPYVFKDTYVRDLSLPETLTTIKEYACSHTGVIVTIPSSVESIEHHAFYNAYGRIHFHNGSQLKEIGDFAFASFDFNNQECFSLPDGLEMIGESAFKGSIRISSIEIPSSVTSIGADLCDRGEITLKVEPDSYAAFYASEYGYATQSTTTNDTSWLNS